MVFRWIFELITMDIWTNNQCLISNLLLTLPWIFLVHISLAYGVYIVCILWYDHPTEDLQKTSIETYKDKTLGTPLKIQNKKYIKYIIHSLSGFIAIEIFFLCEVYCNMNEICIYFWYENLFIGVIYLVVVVLPTFAAQLSSIYSMQILMAMRAKIAFSSGSV